MDIVTCDYPGCIAAATVRWHGTWCGLHAHEGYGRVPAEVWKMSDPSRVITPLMGRRYPRMMSEASGPPMRGLLIGALVGVLMWAVILWLVWP